MDESFVCVDRLATDGLYAIRHGCYILVEPRSDEFSGIPTIQHTMLCATHTAFRYTIQKRMWRGWLEGREGEKRV